MRNLKYRLIRWDVSCNQMIGYYPHTAFGKSGPGGEAMTQFVGIRFRVSDFGCQGTEVLSPETFIS